MRVIGVDCAVAPTNTGVCLATVIKGGPVVVDALAVGSTRVPPADIIDGWLREMDEDVWLVAIDAPLGWPAPLARALSGHVAGRPLAAPSAHAAFRRRTDALVATRTGKRPLDVGADRIARTAFAALELVDHLRSIHGQDLPLAWTPAVTAPSAIEVYPAATLAVRDLPSSGYKGAAGQAAREALIDALDAELTFGREALTLAQATDHAFDAALCALSAADFLGGRADGPEEVDDDVRQEGWIWVARKPT